MTKSSTPKSFFHSSSPALTVAPSMMAIAKIKQFARVYTCVPAEIPALGGLILN